LGLQILIFSRTQTPVLDVSDDANDFRLGIEQCQVEMFSDGILIWLAVSDRR